MSGPVERYDVPTALVRALPAVVPQMRIGEFDPMPRLPAVAVRLCDVLNLRGSPISAAHGSARSALRIAQGTKVVLTGTIKDAFVERLWEALLTRQLLRALTEIGADLVLGPDFSTYGHDPRLEHLYNIKRSERFFHFLASAGVPTIPHLIWHRPEDLRQWQEWLCLHDEVGAVSVSLQTLRQGSWWNAVNDLAELSHSLGREITYLVVGPSTHDRIAELRGALGHVRIITCLPARYAVAAHIVGLDGRKEYAGQMSCIQRLETSVRRMGWDGFDHTQRDREAGEGRIQTDLAEGDRQITGPSGICPGQLRIPFPNPGSSN